MLNKGLIKEPKMYSRLLGMADVIIELQFHQNNIKNFSLCKLNKFFVIELRKEALFSILCLFSQLNFRIQLKLFEYFCTIYYICWYYVILYIIWFRILTKIMKHKTYAYQRCVKVKRK